MNKIPLKTLIENWGVSSELDPGFSLISSYSVLELVPWPLLGIDETVQEHPSLDDRGNQVVGQRFVRRDDGRM